MKLPEPSEHEEQCEISQSQSLSRAMTCLETILHASLTSDRVVVRLSTLKHRAGAALQALRPDMTLRKQINHWARQNGLVACHEARTKMITFTRIA